MLGTLVLLAAGGAVPAWAAPPGHQTSFARSPERGLQGTVITVSGTGCNYGGRAWEKARAMFQSHAKKANGTSVYHTFSDYFPVRDDGTWVGEFVVPAEAPMGDYRLSGTCYAADMALDCGEALFTVGEPLPPTTTTTAPPPTTARPPTTTTTAERARQVTPTTAVATTTTTTMVPEPAPTTTTEPLHTAAAEPPDHGDGRSGGAWAAVAAGVPLLGGGALFLVRRRRH